LKLLKR